MNSNSEKKKVLIISYAFPPYPGIGGRRWAKFTKYLVKNGHEVFVICSENPFKEKSAWINDIEQINIQVYPLPLKYPKFILFGVTSIWDKLIYRMYKLYFSSYSKGVIFERTIFWRQQLQRKASVIIEKEKIKNVIVSIPPYRLASHSIKLKQKYPDINLILDYRDPWTDNKSYHGFKGLSAKRLMYERNQENKALAIADTVIAVSENMTENLKKNNNCRKAITIQNGYDPDDIIVDNKAKYSIEGDKLKFIYAGTVYSNLEYIIEPLLKYFEKLKEKNKPLYDTISFEFYGKQNPEFEKKIKNFDSDIISLHDYLPLIEIQKKIRESMFCIVMSAPDHSFAFNTKFFEYIANHKPILLFSYHGDTSKFILKNNLGFCINPDNIEKDLDSFFAQLQNTILRFNYGFDTEQYGVPYLTSQVEEILK